MVSLILGLIFLRYADILYKQHKEEIEAEYNRFKGGRMEKSMKEISIEKCGFYLPECAYYDFINDAPDDANKATLVKEAMEAIEDENPKMYGVLPKEVYAQLVPEEEPELLSNIVRIFKDIPENSTIDIFGEIYEYFLGNFALAEGKDGGTFYTPATVVRYMVEVLNPQPGEKKFLDPACGSGGMFVQAARYMHNHNANESEQMKFRCYGVEKEPDTVKLAKMNLLLNNVRGDITEANSFYSDPYNAFGQFDYVMANPPFNVDEVVVEKVSDDTRFNTYGVPRNKSKSTKKKSDKKETVPNANYLWIGYFATALNKNGKAALVMANSASDASGSEYDIRKKMIKEGIISQMVTLPSNMFSSVTLPATLWFFDKQKPNTEKKNEILFIDARNVFTQVDRAHRKFSDEQIKNLGVITKLYHGDTQALADLIDEYKAELVNAPESSDNKEILTKSYWQSQIDWLTERFPDGVYTDVIGLCKVAPMDGEDGIIDQNYSLNAGRYVGVVIEDDGLTQEEFKEEMYSLNSEFSSLSIEARKLEELIKNNLKGLLVSEMIDYKIVKITDLGTVNRGKSKHRPRNDSILYGGKYPFIQTADVKRANLYLSDYSQTYNEIGLKQSKLWKKGTLCFTIAANIADSAILDMDACFPDSIVGFLSYENISDTIYVKYLFDELKLYFQQISKGTTQDNLSLDKICRVKLRVPNYETQKKIASVLSAYDNLIENNNKRIHVLEQMAENLYKEWFVRFRFPGYENVEFKEKKPRGWQVGTEDKKHFVPITFKYDEFENIGSFVRGKNITAAKMVKGDIPVISAGLQPSGYHNKANVYGANLTISASGANSGYLKYNMTDVWAADCSYYQDDATIWFVYNTLKYLQPVISNLQCGAAQPHVYPKNLNKLYVLIPTEELINKYNNFVKPYYDEIKILNQHNQLLIKQRDMLLPRLMSGKLEV